MDWLFDLVFVLVGCSVAAFVMRIFTSPIGRTVDQGDLMTVWRRDAAVSVKVGLVPAAIFTVLIHLT